MAASLTELFSRYAGVAGAKVVVANAQAAADLIAGAGAGQIRYNAAVEATYPLICAELAASGRVMETAEALAEGEPDRSALAAGLAGGVGVVLARAGIAETGSLVLADDGLAPRLLGMLADVCVALLPAARIIPSLDDAGVLLGALNAAGHRYVSLVTGPSRTADIERVLTIGVQGPKALLVIVLEGADDEQQPI